MHMSQGDGMYHRSVWLHQRATAANPAAGSADFSVRTMAVCTSSDLRHAQLLLSALP